VLYVEPSLEAYHQRTIKEGHALPLQTINLEDPTLPTLKPSKGRMSCPSTPYHVWNVLFEIDVPEELTPKHVLIVELFQLDGVQSIFCGSLGLAVDLLSLTDSETPLHGFYKLNDQDGTPADMQLEIDLRVWTSEAYINWLGQGDSDANPKYTPRRGLRSSSFPPSLSPSASPLIPRAASAPNLNIEIPKTPYINFASARARDSPDNLSVNGSVLRPTSPGQNQLFSIKQQLAFVQSEQSKALDSLMIYAQSLEKQLEEVKFHAAQLQQENKHHQAQITSLQNQLQATTRNGIVHGAEPFRLKSPKPTIAS